MPTKAVGVAPDPRFRYCTNPERPLEIPAALSYLDGALTPGIAMCARQRSYICPLCRWQGMLEPSAPTEDACCPECGVLLSPQTWMQTWGVALALILVVVGLLALVVALR